RVPGRDPEELEADARRAQEEHAALQQSVQAATKTLDDAIRRRTAAEEEYAVEERRIAGLLRAAADQREGLARLHGQLNALKSRAAGADEEIGRLESAAAAARERAAQAHREFTALESQIAGLAAGESGLDEELEAAEAQLADAEAAVEALTVRRHEAERRHDALRARTEALELGLSRKDGAGALLADAEAVEGLLGSIASLITVHTGHEAALGAALGAAAEALAVADVDAAIEAIERLRDHDLGRAGIVIGGAGDGAGDWPELPDGARYAMDLIDAPAPLRPALARLLNRVAVVDDLAAARRLIAQIPDIQAVTRDGDRLGAHFAEGGSSATQSLIEVAAALDEATAELAEVTSTLDRLRFEAERADQGVERARERVDTVLQRLHESDATMSAVAEKLGELGTTSRAAVQEAERLEASIEQAKAAREQAMSGLADVQARVALAEQAPDTEPDTADMERLAEAASAARRAETDARLALRTAEERARALAGQVESMLAAAAAEREARQRAARHRERRRREAEVAEAVLRGIEVSLSRLEGSMATAAARRTQVEQDRSGREEQLKQTRSRLRVLEAELKQLTDSVHRDEMARSQMLLKLEQLHERALQEVGIEPDTLVAEYGPDQLVPVVGEEGAEPVPYVREEQVRRLRHAEKSLAMLGKVNPLALEEFSALEERHQFLSEQLDDLKKTRQDLLDIVEEVDQKVEQVFTEAWQDVEREFTDVFGRLFPGGEGRLVLTDPSSMLTTGIDVEARPPGKKVKRLSLLSGGERSLVAVAFLVALFKARPSPFYILDEVEAALDDTNLGRLLEIYEELRATSQLIVITHQKRTMEVADALYGVSMRGDGVSAVISQRLREDEESA
ncbi:AAA family ATPase, partial [uncultured Aeromicrobium sp.]|uniref:AAA family ATPase n=1 Tax=uncultured Aeromicrobium sp. TaxID=337820 RepID=UPI0025EAD7F1